MVRYCPGSSVGTPAGMPLNDADRYKVEGTRYLQIQQAVGAIDKPVFPHIGSCPPNCPHYQPPRHQRIP